MRVPSGVMVRGFLIMMLGYFRMLGAERIDRLKAKRTVYELG